MKRGSGIKGRDDRSNGIEIHIADDLAKINPTDPLIFAKQAAAKKSKARRFFFFFVLKCFSFSSAPPSFCL